MRRILLALAASATLLPGAALAQQAYAPVRGAQPYSLAYPPGLEFDLAAGYLNSSSRELVYDTSTKRKLSELRWRDPSAYGLDGTLAFRVVPWLTARVRGFVPLGSKDSQMKDFDWIPPYNVNGSFSDFSKTPRTELASGYKVDGSLQGDFVQTPDYAFGIVAGYEQQQWRWKGRGGDYLYSVNGYRDTTGSFGDGIVITYRQGWSTPYAGLVGSVQLGDLKLTARGIGSPYAMARANDIHVLRGLNIKSSYDPGVMFGGDLRAEYAVTNTVAVVGTASYQEFRLAKGRASYIDGGLGTTTPYGPDGAGVDRKALLVTLGLSARM